MATDYKALGKRISNARKQAGITQEALGEQLNMTRKHISVIEFIHQAANELVQNVGTRNIKQIARSCSLDISETSRIRDMLGLLSLY